VLGSYSVESIQCAVAVPRLPVHGGNHTTKEEKGKINSIAEHTGSGGGSRSDRHHRVVAAIPRLADVTDAIVVGVLARMLQCPLTSRGDSMGLGSKWFFFFIDTPRRRSYFLLCHLMV
jgi:hypothetical protein